MSTEYVPETAPGDPSMEHFAVLLNAVFASLFQMQSGITIDASGNTAGRATHDGEAKGFWYYDSQAGFFYQKESATSADWSDGVPTPTGALLNVVEDLTPQLGANLDAQGFDVTGSGQVHLTGATAGYTPLKGESSEAGAARGPILELKRSSASPADADVLGAAVFVGKDDGAADNEYAAIEAVADDVSAGAEDGAIDVYVAKAGTKTKIARFEEGGFRLGTGGVNVDTILDEDDMASDDADALPTQQSVKAYIDAGIKTGTYTGDGTESQGIIGIGFQPRMVQITRRVTANGTVEVYWTTDQIIDDHANGGCIVFLPNGNHEFRSDRIISLDSDGFTVDDGAINNDPNVDGLTYNYIAWR